MAQANSWGIESEADELIDRDREKEGENSDEAWTQRKTLVYGVCMEYGR